MYSKAEQVVQRITENYREEQRRTEKNREVQTDPATSLLTQPASKALLLNMSVLALALALTWSVSNVHRLQS